VAIPFYISKSNAIGQTQFDLDVFGDQVNHPGHLLGEYRRYLSGLAYIMIVAGAGRGYQRKQVFVVIVAHAHTGCDNTLLVLIFGCQSGNFLRFGYTLVRQAIGKQDNAVNVIFLGFLLGHLVTLFQAVVQVGHIARVQFVYLALQLLFVLYFDRFLD